MHKCTAHVATHVPMVSRTINGPFPPPGSQTQTVLLAGGQPPIAVPSMEQPTVLPTQCSTNQNQQFQTTVNSLPSQPEHIEAAAEAEPQLSQNVTPSSTSYHPTPKTTKKSQQPKRDRQEMAYSDPDAPMPTQQEVDDYVEAAHSQTSDSKQPKKRTRAMKGHPTQNESDDNVPTLRVPNLTDTPTTLQPSATQYPAGFQQPSYSGPLPVPVQTMGREEQFEITSSMFSYEDAVAPLEDHIKQLGGFKTTYDLDEEHRVRISGLSLSMEKRNLKGFWDWEGTANINIPKPYTKPSIFKNVFWKKQKDQPQQ